MNKIVYIFLLVWLVALYFYAPSFPNTEMTVLLLCISAVSIVIFLLRKEFYKEIKNNNVRHSTLFLFGYLVVHFQLHIDYLLSNIKKDNYFIWVDNEIVIKALTLSTIGLISFLLGYLSFNNRKMIKKLMVMHVNNRVGTLFLEITALILLGSYFSLVNPLYFLGNYGKIDIGTSAAYVVLAFEAVMMALIVQKSTNMRHQGADYSLLSYVKSMGLLFGILLFIYLASVLLSGDRGPIIYFGLALFGSYLLVSKRKINWGYATLYLIIGSYAVTILGQVRASRDSSSFSEKVVKSVSSREESRFGFQSVVPQTQELATSIRTLHYAIDYVPKREDYMYGRFQFQQVTSIIPFFSIVNSNIHTNNDSQYYSSSAYITWIDQGNYVYSGLGTTIIADFYLDFGVIGVLIAMFLVGYIFRYLELILFRTNFPSMFAYTLSLVYLSNSVYMSRSTFLIVLKAVCWAYFFVYINSKISKLKKK